METIKKYGLGKSQRLKSRKLIQSLFAEGKSFHHFPLKVIWVQNNDSNTLQAGFSVSSRLFKRAVDRNCIKRLMRECYRVQKVGLEKTLIQSEKSLAVFFIYTGKEKIAHAAMFEAMTQAIKKLIRHHEGSHQ